MRRTWRAGRLLALLLLVAEGAVVQAQTTSPAASVGQQLASLTARAAVVFVGQVVKIERKGVAGGGMPVMVEVTFAVQQTVIGEAGATFVLREWGGLWPPGAQRYRVGQRAMMFLHAATGAGLSSPVDGMDGVVPLVPMGADQAPLLDVRRLATGVTRSVGAPMAGVQAMALPDVTALVRLTAATPTITLLGPVAIPVARPLPVGAAPRPIAPITFELPLRMQHLPLQAVGGDVR